MLDLACRVGLKKCLDEAGVKFEDWLKDPQERPKPDVRGLVYTYGMQVKGNEENWPIVWDLFIKETDAQEKVKLMASLASVRDPSLLQM